LRPDIERWGHGTAGANIDIVLQAINRWRPATFCLQNGCRTSPKVHRIRAAIFLNAGAVVIFLV
jgi:hypothetical protein